ncbi:MAG: hypothetical protein ACFFD8_01110 [Candidatus Thorarchaeota archaeon]
MKLGEILTKSKSRLSSYGISYRHPFEIYFDLFLADDEIKPVHVSSILVLTDKRPRSLIAIAYALRLAKALNANLIAITLGLHQELIKGEAESNNVNLAFIKSLSKQPTIEYIQEVIQNYDVGLVVHHNLYTLLEDILESSPVPVLVVKVNKFFQSTPPLELSKE